MKKNDFEYKYVAPTVAERKEIESIRDSYIAKPISQVDSKLDRLRKLDFRVKNIPLIVSLAIGILFTLVFGLGLTMILEWNQVLSGVIVSAVSILPMIFNYLIFCHMSTFLKSKHKDEILKLSNELLNNENN